MRKKFRNFFYALKSRSSFVCSQTRWLANSHPRRLIYIWWTLYIYIHERGRDLLISQQLYAAGKFDIRYGVSSLACFTMMYSRCKSGVFFFKLYILRLRGALSCSLESTQFIANHAKIRRKASQLVENVVENVKVKMHIRIGNWKYSLDIFNYRSNNVTRQFWNVHYFCVNYRYNEMIFRLDRDWRTESVELSKFLMNARYAWHDNFILLKIVISYRRYVENVKWNSLLDEYFQRSHAFIPRKTETTECIFNNAGKLYN